jgi:hypothetical protein
MDWVFSSPGFSPRVFFCIGIWTTSTKHNQKKHPSHVLLFYTGAQCLDSCNAVISAPNPPVPEFEFVPAIYRDMTMTGDRRQCMMTSSQAAVDAPPPPPPPPLPQIFLSLSRRWIDRANPLVSIMKPIPNRQPPPPSLSALKRYEAGDKGRPWSSRSQPRPTTTSGSPCKAQETDRHLHICELPLLLEPVAARGLALLPS